LETASGLAEGTPRSCLWVGQLFTGLLIAYFCFLLEDAAELVFALPLFVPVLTHFFVQRDDVEHETLSSEESE